MPPKTNEKWVEEFQSLKPPNDNNDLDGWERLDNWLRTLLTTKDKEREEAVAEAYEKGKAEVFAKWVAQEEFDGPRDL